MAAYSVYSRNEPEKKGGIIYPWWRGRPTMDAVEFCQLFDFLGSRSLLAKQKRGSHPTQGLVGWRPSHRRGVIFCGVGLTENSSWCVVTGETGLTHTRTISQIISIIVLVVFGSPSGSCGARWKAIGMDSICRRGRIRGGNDCDRG